MPNDRITLRTHNDIARAMASLGLSAELLEKDKKLDKALEDKKADNPALVKALKDVLKHMDGSERRHLAAAVGDTADALTRGNNAGVTVGSSLGVGGVMPFAIAQQLDGAGRIALPLTKNTDEVAALLVRHGVRGVAERPFERVLVHVATIDEVLRSETDPEKLVELVMQKDIRRQVFLLEGIAKLYQDIHGDPAVQVYENTKRLEDALGAVSMTKSNLTFALEVHKKQPLDPRVLTTLEEELAKAKTALQKILVDEWVPRKDGALHAEGQSPAMQSIIRGWGDARWASYDKDIKKVREEIASRLEKLESTPFDMNDLQGGVHELRRQLRWIPIYSEALNGLVHLDDDKNPIAAYAPLLQDPLAQSKYVTLPAPTREQKTIEVPKSLYVAAMKLILDLGAIKDAGEPIEFLVKAFVQSGVTDAAQAHHLVLELVGGAQVEADLHKKAEAAYDEMRKTRLLDALKDAYAG